MSEWGGGCVLPLTRGDEYRWYKIIIMLLTDIFIPFKLVGPLAKMATLIINLRCFSVAIALSLMSLSSFAYFSLPGHFVTLFLLLLQNLIQ